MKQHNKPESTQVSTLRITDQINFLAHQALVGGQLGAKVTYLKNLEHNHWRGVMKHCRRYLIVHVHENRVMISALSLVT